MSNTSLNQGFYLDFEYLGTESIRWVCVRGFWLHIFRKFGGLPQFSVHLGFSQIDNRESVYANSLSFKSSGLMIDADIILSSHNRFDMIEFKKQIERAKECWDESKKSFKYECLKEKIIKTTKSGLGKSLDMTLGSKGIDIRYENNDSVYIPYSSIKVVSPIMNDYEDVSRFLIIHSTENTEMLFQSDQYQTIIIIVERIILNCICMISDNSSEEKIHISKSSDEIHDSFDYEDPF